MYTHMLPNLTSYLLQNWSEYLSHEPYKILADFLPDMARKKT